MKNVKQWLITGKEWWKDKKKRGFLFLGFYFIFFLVIIACARMGASPDTKPMTPTLSALEFYQKMDNYEYTLTIHQKTETKEDLFSFTGTRKGATEKVLDKDTLYIGKEDGWYQEEKKVTFDLPIAPDSFRPEVVASWIENASLVDVTTYQEGMTKKLYRFTVRNDEAPYVNMITVYEEGNRIDKVEINASNQAKLLKKDILSYQIVLEYKNIDQIESL